MRKRTGLRNRFRVGRRRYSVANKSDLADKYGKWDKGRRTSSEIVNGHQMTYDMLKDKSTVSGA